MDCIRSICLIPLLLFLSPIIGQESIAQQKLPTEEKREVTAGSVDILDLNFAPGSADIGDKRLLSIKETQGVNQLQVRPQKPGSTTVLIRGKKGEIKKNIKYIITSTQLSKTVEYIRSLLENIEGITINSLGENIVIDGELVVPKDLDRILNVLRAYSSRKGPKIINLLTISKVSQRAMAKRIQDEINRKPGGANVTVRLANDTFFLEGTVDASADRTRAQQIAETYIPEILGSVSVSRNILSQIKRPALRNLISIRSQPQPKKKMVRVTFHFVEMSKEYSKSIFFKWSPLISSGAGLILGSNDSGSVGADAAAGSTLSGTITNLLPKLQRGTNGGYARVLFSTVGIGLEGTTISISRKEDIPHIESVAGGVPVIGYSQSGISVAVSPSIVEKDTVQLSGIEFSFGVPSGAGAGDQPRITNTSMKNNILLKSGESAVLGGLISNNMSLGVDKDPEQAVPGNPLFTLLRSRAFSNNKTQFIVFITPQIIESSSKGTEDIKRKIIGNTKKRKRVYR